jgi:hypothetical protein
MASGANVPSAIKVGALIFWRVVAEGDGEHSFRFLPCEGLMGRRRTDFFSFFMEISDEPGDSGRGMLAEVAEVEVSWNREFE